MTTKQLSWCITNIFGFQLLNLLENDHLITFNFTTMCHQYCTTFTFSPLKSITKHLFIKQHMFIPFSVIFKSPALDKYASTSSLSKSSKFLILQFLVKCCKSHSVFKIPSKSHTLDILQFQVCTTSVDTNYDFILSKSLDNPNLLYVVP